jgi:hypothetical protein
MNLINNNMNLINNNSIVEINDEPRLINQFATKIYHKWNEICTLLSDTVWNCFVFERQLKSVWQNLRETLVLKKDWTFIKTYASLIDDWNTILLPSLDWEIVDISKTIKFSTKGMWYVVCIDKIKEWYGTIVLKDNEQESNCIEENHQIELYKDEDWNIIKVFDMLIPDENYIYSRVLTNKGRLSVDEDWTIITKYKVWKLELPIDYIDRNGSVTISEDNDDDYISISTDDVDMISMAKELGWMFMGEDDENKVWYFDIRHSSHFLLDKEQRNKIMPWKIDWKFFPSRWFQDFWLHAFEEEYWYCRRKNNEVLWYVEYERYRFQDGSICNVWQVYETLGIIERRDHGFIHDESNPRHGLENPRYYRMDKNNPNLLSPIDSLNDNEKLLINWKKEYWFDKIRAIDESDKFLEEKNGRDYHPAYIDTSIFVNLDGYKINPSGGIQEDRFLRERSDFYKFKQKNESWWSHLIKKVGLSYDRKRWLYRTSSDWIKYNWYEILVISDWNPLSYTLNDQEVIVINTLQDWKFVVLKDRNAFTFLTYWKHGNEIMTHNWFPVINYEKIDDDSVKITYVTLNDIVLEEIVLIST